jgi:hypothetical protein
MIDDPDIYRGAKLLIEQHSEGAPIRAPQRAEALQDEGDVDGCIVWRWILEAIEDLTRRRCDGESVN